MQSFSDRMSEKDYVMFAKFIRYNTEITEEWRSARDLPQGRDEKYWQHVIHRDCASTAGPWNSNLQVRKVQ